MADLTITASQVLAASTAVVAHGTAGATITAGQPLYLDSADNELKLADNNNTAATATVVGISLHGASDGQPLAYIVAGELTLGAGAAPVNGTVYCLSDTAGAIAPAADISTTGERLVILGGGIGSNKIKVAISNTGGTV